MGSRRESRMKQKSCVRAVVGVVMTGVAIRVIWTHMDLKARAPGLPDQSGESAGIIEPLTLAGLGQRVGDVYREGYLTVLAIIQGVAFGILLTDAEGQWVRHADPLYRAKVVMQAAAVLIAIIVVTHRYILLTVIGRWIPTTFDTIIPYALGVGEIGASLAIGRNLSWWASVGFFSLAGVSSFVHSRIRMSATSFGSIPQLYSRFRRITTTAIISLSLLAVTSAAMVAVSAYDAGSPWLYASSPFLFVIATMAVEIAGSYQISKLS